MRGRGWGRDIPGEPPRQVRLGGPRGRARAAPRAWAWLCPPDVEPLPGAVPESVLERREAQLRLQLGRLGHAQLHVGTCSVYLHARPCALGRLRRDRFAKRQPSADRFRSADPAAASGTRAFAEPSPSLPTELAVPRPPRPRAASWPWENRDRGCPSWGRAGAQALGSRVPLWPVLPRKHPFLRPKFQRKRTWRWGWGGGGGRSHLEACSPATLPGCRESLQGTCRGGEAS